MIKGIIFDLGGVLAYDVQEYLFYEKRYGVIDKYNLDGRRVREVQGWLWEKYAHTKQDHEERWQDLEKEYWEDFKHKLGLDIPTSGLIKLSEKYIKPVKGINILLDWLRENGFDLLICSNNSEFWFQRQKQVVGLDKYFEKKKIILSNHFGVDKHKPPFIMLQAVEKQMKYPKEEYLFIDDRIKNIEVALQFGVTPLLFPAESPLGYLYVQGLINIINGT